MYTHIYICQKFLKEKQQKKKKCKVIATDSSCVNLHKNLRCPF